MWSGERRRSARILELEARKIESEGKGTCYAEEDEDSGNDDSPRKPRRKKVKIRPVQDLVASTIKNQLKTEVGNSSNGDRRTNSAAIASGTALSERRNTFLIENGSILSAVSRSSKQLIQTKQDSIGHQESLMWFSKDLGPPAQMVAEQKLQKGAEDLNPHDATSNFQRRALDQIPNVATLQKGKNALVGDVPSSYLRWQAEKIFGRYPSAPQLNSGPSRSPALGNTPGLMLNSGYPGGGLPQFQPMAGSGSTHYGGNFEQASQGLNWSRPTELEPQLPIFNKPFQQQAGLNTSTSGSSIKAIELSHIDEWLPTSRNRERSNNGAPPAASQEQAEPGTNIFPWTLRL